MLWLSIYEVSALKLYFALSYHTLYYGIICSQLKGFKKWGFKKRKIFFFCHWNEISGGKLCYFLKGGIFFFFCRMREGRETLILLLR